MLLDLTRERINSFIADKSQMEKITMRFWIEYLSNGIKGYDISIVLDVN